MARGATFGTRLFIAKRDHSSSSAGRITSETSPASAPASDVKAVKIDLWGRQHDRGSQLWNLIFSCKSD
jgi:hypothetical protein